MAINVSYWQKRAERLLYEQEKRAFHAEVQLLRQFQTAQREVKKALEELALDKDGKLVSQTAWRREKIDREMTRQRALQSRLESAIKKLGDYEQKKMSGVLSDSYEEAYYHTIYDFQTGIGYTFDFATLDEGAIKTAIEGRWYNHANYSDRLWVNKAALEQSLKNHITQGIIKGEDIGKMIDRVSADLGSGYSATQRLIRTEVNHIYNQAALDGLAENGVEEYRFLATLDNRTSSICRELDGKVFKVADQKPGVNAPPMHPHCRSTIIPEISWGQRKNLIESRAARDPDTGKSIEVSGDITYKQWQEQISTVRQQKKAQELSDTMKWIDDCDGISKGEVMHAELAEDLTRVIAKGDSEKRKRALKQYLGDSYRKTQNVARGYGYHDDDDVERERVLHEVLQDASLPRTSYVCRGTGRPNLARLLGIDGATPDTDALAEAVQGRVGDVIHNGCYMSTTRRRFEGDFDDTSWGEKGVVYHIEVPKGAHALDVQDVAVYKTEEEILIDKDSYYQIVGVEVRDAKRKSVGKLVHVFLRMLTE